METHVRTPQDVFMQPQHLVVPPFQRPYVWEKEEQWAPLWQDVRRLAELRLGQPSAMPGTSLARSWFRRRSRSSVISRRAASSTASSG